MTAPPPSLVAEAQWSARWAASPLPAAIDPAGRDWRRHLDRLVYRHLAARLAEVAGPGRAWLEVGAAQSVFLPAFARQLGVAVTGLDYSPIGCARLRDLFAASGVSGRVAEADLFNPPQELRGTFDAVLSFGVVEHFPDTVAALQAKAAFLKPGGLMATLVPNLSGLPGWLQRRLDRRVYDEHVVLTPRALATAHAAAGLAVRESRAVGALALSALNVAGGLRPPFASLVPKLFAGLSLPVWLLEGAGLPLPATRALAPYVIAIARRP